MANLARAVLLGGLSIAARPGAAAALRVCVISGDEATSAGTREAAAGLADFLEGSGSIECRRQYLTDGDGSEEAWSALKASEVAVLWVRARAVGEQGKAAIREFLEKGGGVVVLGASGGTWTDWPEFENEVLGARFGAKFAGGVPMRVINLYPNSIFTGVDHFETPQVMYQCDLASDAQVIMEGTVGEETVPMGWVRRHSTGRIVCFQPGGRVLLADPQFRGMVSNGVRWAANRPVPGARALVQRGYMGGSYPGALAVNFPGGPSLCFDTVRGGINYIWDDDFVDLRPWWTARHGDPLRAFAARISGDVLYQDKSMSQAMHLGSNNEPSDFHFRGYRLGKDGFPDLSYTVGGRGVTEELQPAGDGVGVECTFHVAPGPSPLWLRLASDSGVEVSGAVRDGNYVHFDATSAGDFAVTYRKKASSAP